MIKLKLFDLFGWFSKKSEHTTPSVETQNPSLQEQLMKNAQARLEFERKQKSLRESVKVGSVWRYKHPNEWIFTVTEVYPEKNFMCYTVDTPEKILRSFGDIDNFLELHELIIDK